MARTGPTRHRRLLLPASARNVVLAGEVAGLAMAERMAPAPRRHRIARPALPRTRPRSSRKFTVPAGRTPRTSIHVADTASAHLRHGGPFAHDRGPGAATVRPARRHRPARAIDGPGDRAAPAGVAPTAAGTTSGSRRSGSIGRSRPFPARGAGRRTTTSTAGAAPAGTTSTCSAMRTACSSRSTMHTSGPPSEGHEGPLRGRERTRPTYSVIWWKVTRPDASAAPWAWAPQTMPSMTLQTCVGRQSASASWSGSSRPADAHRSNRRA